MFGLKNVVATVVALAALAVPSLALADNPSPRDRRVDDHASIQHRESREHRGDWRRDRHDRHERHDRYEHGRRDWRDHGRR